MLDIVLAPLDPIVSPILGLVEGFASIVYLVIEFAKLVPKLFEIIFYVIDPMKLIKDVIFAVTTGLTMVLEAVLDIMFGEIRNSFIDKAQRGSDDGDAPPAVCFGKSFMGMTIMVLCPPLYIALIMGLSKGIVPTLLCCLFTYFYYVPGLLYALLYCQC